VALAAGPGPAASTVDPLGEGPPDFDEPRGIFPGGEGRLRVELTRPSDSPDRVAHPCDASGTLLHVARRPADVALLTGSRPLLLEDRARGLRTLPDGASQIVRIDWER
jgi:hypothetical protein